MESIKMCKHCGMLITGDNVKEDYSFSTSQGKTLIKELKKCKNCNDEDEKTKEVSNE